MLTASDPPAHPPRTQELKLKYPLDLEDRRYGHLPGGAPPPAASAASPHRARSALLLPPRAVLCDSAAA